MNVKAWQIFTFYLQYGYLQNTELAQYTHCTHIHKVDGTTPHSTKKINTIFAAACNSWMSACDLKHRDSFGKEKKKFYILVIKYSIQSISEQLLSFEPKLD